MSWQSLSPVGVLAMAGMRVIPLRGLAPKGLILIDSGPGFLWKQGKNESEERRESRQHKPNVGSHFLSFSGRALQLRHGTFHLPGVRAKNPRPPDSLSVTPSHPADHLLHLLS